MTRIRPPDPDYRPPISTDQTHRVVKVARVVASTIGKDYLNAMVEHLAKALGADCAYVTQLVGRPPASLRSVAAYGDGAPAAAFVQELPGSAAAQVLADGCVAWRRGVTQLFPLDELLSGIKAEGYAGIRLRNSRGEVLGLIAVIGRQELRNIVVAQSVLETFAPRTAAELERERADEAVRESEERYRAFIASSRDGMWRIEFKSPIPLDLPEAEQIESIYRDGYVAECNEALARMMGAAGAADLVGAPFDALFSRDDARVREELAAAVRSGYSAATFATAPVDQAGRKTYRLRTQCGIIRDNCLLRVWGATRDITEWKRAELAAEMHERRFRDVFENIGLPALILKPGSGIVFCNDAAARLVHRRKQDLEGGNWLELLASEADRKTWRDLIGDDGGAGVARRHFEGPLQIEGHPPRLMAWDTIPLRDEDDLPGGLAAIGRDVTDEHALRERMQQSERLDAVARFAAGIAHDFNDLLTIILGNTADLSRRGGVELPIHPGLAAIENAAEQCARLTHQLLTIGRKQIRRPERLDLNALIAAEETAIRRMIGPKIDLVLFLEPALGSVYADPAQIRFVIATLTENARDAMPEGGILTIVTANYDADNGAAAEAGIPSGRYVELQISDTGNGLAEEVRQHLFDPFLTTKADGKRAGLGLTTVYGIVAQSDGRIWIRSAPEAGTLVEILLPRILDPLS